VGGIKGPIKVPVWDITDEQWNRTLAVSLTATFLCTREAARVMIGQRSGKIVNIASTSWAPPDSAMHPHYAAAKAGVVAFTRAVALQLAPYDVNVNAVAPGATRRSVAVVVDDGRGGYFSSGAILVQTVWMCLATAFSGMPPIEAQKYTVSTGAAPILSRTRRATSSGVP
jgi:NAD(P)-dependent dehydrogenase (short-subunit alcohol dehydrogenase family)